MDNTKKPNDWFVAQLKNPTFTMSNFKDVGLTADNTGLLDKTAYKNNKQIQELFKDENGKFNETAFNQKYDSAAQTYQKFANDEFEESVFSDVDWDPFSQLKPDDAKDRELDFNVTRVLNPDRLKTGVSQIGRTDNREWTASELAQKQKVFNHKTGKYEDYTPNDNVLFGNPVGFLKSLSEPLVLAQWDEAGEHKDPYTGRMVKHAKGELKYNDEGTYYYETLGDREAYGRKFKSAFDSFTVDGSAANKYDFFDSDGLDKSVTGTVMKTVVSLAPLFVPVVNTYYGGAMIGAQLLDILPTIYKSTLGLNDDTPTANLIQGIGRTLKGSKSEYSQGKLMSTENFFDLVTDVALQWQQQRTIFKGMNKLLGTEKKQIAAMQAADLESAKMVAKNAEAIQRSPEVMGSIFEMGRVQAGKGFEALLKKNNRMAANTALGYMAMMQGLSTFEDAIEQGADRSEAAAIAWGAVAGMYAVDRTGLGELFFPELKGNQATLRGAIQQVTDDVNKGLSTMANTVGPKPNKLAKLFDNAKKYSSNYWSDIRNHTTGFVGKAIGEGLEEVSEEAVVDLAKATFNWASDMGYTKSGVQLDAWENAMERYGMNFFGGAIGGAIFYGVDVVQNGKATNEQTNQELIYLIRNGRTSELMEELGQLRKKGKLGNKNLSATKTEDTADGTVWTSPTNVNDNQNEAVYNLTKNYIQHLDAVIHQEGLDLSDEQILDKLVMGDIRMKNLMNIERTDGEKFGKAIINGYQGKALQDFNSLASKIKEKRDQIKTLEKTTSDEDKKLTTYTNALQKYQQEYADLELQKQKFLDGTFAKHYTDQMLFAIDNNVNFFAYAPTFEDYVEYRSGMNFQDMSPEQANGYKDDYESYRKMGKMQSLDAAFEIYKKLNGKFSVMFEQGAVSLDDYYKAKEWANDTLIDYTATIDKLSIPNTEDAEQVITSKFNNDRNVKPVLNKKFVIEAFTPVEGESAQDASAREQALAERNLEALGRIQAVVQEIQKYGFIDRDTRNLLLSAMGDKITTKKFADEVKGDLIINNHVSISTDADGNIVPNALRDTLLAELDKVEDSNVDEVVKNIHDIINSEEYQQSLMNDTLDFFDETGEDYDYDSPETDPNVISAVKERSSNLEKIYSDAAKSINEKIINDPFNSTLLTLRDNVINTTVSPLYGYLQQITSTTYGSQLDLFNILESETRRFTNAPTAADYVMDGNREAEIEKAFQILEITEALINAASTADLDINQPFGHNATMNYFIENYFPKEEKYGVIRDDVAGMMKRELVMVARQLEFLKNLSRLNSVNQFTKHARTGQKVSQLMADTIKGTDRFKFLKDLNYKGIPLFKGIDAIATPTLDNIENASYDDPLISKELSQLQNTLYDNFQEMLNTTGDSAQTILKDLFSNVRTQFNINKLVEQKNTRFGPDTKALEDYDVYIMLHAMLALKKSDFDYYLRESLVDTNAEYAPLFSQEYSAYIAAATAVNPEVMNAAITNIETPESSYGSELLRYYNTVMVDGMGGAGKSAVVANIIQNLIKKYNPDSEIWKAGPEQDQVDNLNKSLGEDGRSFKLDDLMKLILGDANYAELVNDLKSSNTDSKQYDIVNYQNIALPNGGVQENYKVAVVNKDIEYAEIKAPKAIIIDEATWVNSIYMQHLSNWARKNGTTIVLLGDLNQNGYTDLNNHVFNVKPSEALMVRTPKLDISLRITNSQKDDNNKTINALMNTLDKNFDASTFADARAAEDAAKQALKDIKDRLTLHHFQDADNVLNGEKVVNSVTEEEVNKILEKDGVVGYVYDNANTETYKLLSKMKDKGANIRMLTPKQVQGLELPHFIIDVDFNGYDTENFGSILDMLRSFYTTMSRSKEGTYLLNNGLSKFLEERNLIQDKHTSTTPDPKTIIGRFKEIRMNSFNAELEGYTPAIKAKGSSEITPPPSADAAPEPPTPVPVDSDPEPPSTEIPISNLNNNPLAAEFVADIEGKGEEAGIDAVLLREPLTGIRAYGWYMRYGMTPVGDGKYARSPKDDVVDDLNVFTQRGVEYTDDTLKKPKRMLVDVRNYLTFGESFDADFIKSLADNGYVWHANLGADVWNSGTFNLEIRKDDTSTTGTDIARDKQGYNVAKVEPVAFNIVYRVPIKGGKDLQFTIGKLTNPDTWKKWSTSHGNDKALNTKIESYRRWYKDMQKQVLDNPASVTYLGIDKDAITFSAATRLKKVEGTTWNLSSVREEFPNALVSPLYIYSGDGGTAMVDKTVRGKGVIFVTSNKHLKIDGEKVTESNLADMYLKMQRKRKAAYDDAIASRLSEDQANQSVAKTVPPLIRMVVANPEGAFIDDYFRLSFSDLTYTDDSGKTKLDTQQVKDYLGTFGSNTTAARMLVSMWNYRAGLQNFVDAYDSYRELNGLEEVRGATEVDNFNKSIDQSVYDKQKRVPWNSSIYNGFMFRLTYADAIKANAPGMVVRPINLSNSEWDSFNHGGRIGRDLTHGVYIDPSLAKAQLKILDSMFNVIGGYLSLPPNKGFTISTNGKDMNSILAQLIADKGEIEFSDGKSTFKHAASSIGGMGGATKLVGLMSSVYKLFSKGRKTDDSYVFRAKGRDGVMKETLLDEINMDIVRAVSDAGRDNYYSVLNNMFNVMFHGTPTIKEGAATTTYAPFINGIYYTPRYRTSHDSHPSDFYPARNHEDQFYIDTAIEDPNFEITIDPTTLKPREFDEVVPHERQAEFSEKLNALTTNLSQEFTGYDSIDGIINEAQAEYQTQGDVALNTIVGNASSKIGTVLQEGIKRRQLKRGNSPILSMETTIGPSGMLTITAMTDLLTEIDKVSSSVLPKSEDGSIDQSTVQLISFDNSNLTDFTVTLQGEQTIKGKIVDGAVKLEDTIMYEVPFNPQREQQLQLFEETINDFDNLRETEIADLIRELRAAKSLTPEAADALLNKAKLVDSHFEGYLTEDQLDNPDILDVWEYINQLGTNKQVIDSQNCKFNI